jgi:hypothetical protein
MSGWGVKVTVAAPLMLGLAAVSALATGGFQQWIGASLQLSGQPVAASNSVLSEHELAEIEGLAPQEQAHRLLQRAVNGYQGALEQIEKRVGGWTGKLDLEPLNSLSNVAYCSSNLRVRSAAVEISLAGYGLPKTARSVDEQVELLRAGTEKAFYPLWKLGLLGNRGVEPETVRRVLLDHLTSNNLVTRRWAVNGLGMLGSSDAIEPLIGVFRHDPSPEIRERAACNLADSGMLTREQRLLAIPHLLTMTDDVTLDAQTRGWVFQALREISGESGIGSEPARWRNWWATRQTSTRPAPANGALNARRRSRGRNPTGPSAAGPT